MAFAFDVRDGSYGKVDLRGSRVVLVVRAPDHMMKGNWKAALYIDETTSEEQRQCLEQYLWQGRWAYAETCWICHGICRGKVRTNYDFFRCR